MKNKKSSSQKKNFYQSIKWFRSVKIVEKKERNWVLTSRIYEYSFVFVNYIIPWIFVFLKLFIKIVLVAIKFFHLVLCPWICSSVSWFIVYENLNRICILLLCENCVNLNYVELVHSIVGVTISFYFSVYSFY